MWGCAKVLELGQTISSLTFAFVAVRSAAMHTRFDQAMKQLVRACLEQDGTFTPEVEVSPDPQAADGYFVPKLQRNSPVMRTFLGRMTHKACGFEFFSCTPDAQELGECVRKLMNLRHQLFTKDKTAVLPIQWIISSGFPKNAFGAYGARRARGWPRGVYRLAPGFATYIVVVSELPEERSTLLLRLMGRGRTLRRAIAELKTLSEDEFERCMALPILVKFRIAASREPVSPADQEYVMDTQEIMDMFKQQAVLQGKLEGKRDDVFLLLRRRFGEIPEAVLVRVNAADLTTASRYFERAFDAASPEEVVADG